MDKDFVWTDGLVKQFAEEFRYSSSRTSIEQFKKMELEKRQAKPTINTWVSHPAEIGFYLSGSISPIIVTKEHLAELLIADSKNQLFIDPIL